ncbi:MAG: hypothetical protein ABI183_15995 [Polyangiaceae bacterium]
MASQALKCRSPARGQLFATASLAAGTFNTQANFVRDVTLSPTDPTTDVMTLTIKTPAPDAGFIVSHPGMPSAVISIDADFPVESPIGVTVETSAELGALAPPVGFAVDCDFGNTARLTITLPSGYTFTSASGVFLSDPGAPGLGLPPDGGTGVHGVPGGSGSDASTGGSGEGGTGEDGSTGDDAGSSASPGSSDSGGCNTTGSASTGVASLGGLAAFAALATLRARRRRRRRRRR